MPGSWLSQYSPVNGRSVPFFCVTLYCSGDRASTAAGFLLYSFATGPPWFGTRITSSGVELVPVTDLVDHGDDLVGNGLWLVEHLVVPGTRNDDVGRAQRCRQHVVRLVDLCLGVVVRLEVLRRHE